jgi:hypothetical protein
MAYEKGAMTAFAQAALAASDLINTKFASTRFGGKVQRQVVVEAPNVESTGGGKQARESIVLKPVDGAVGDSVTCGFLDVGLRSCELRSYATLNMQHKQRYSTAIDLPQAEYDRFLGELGSLLEGEGFVLRVVQPEEQQAKAIAAGNAGGASSGSNNMAMIAIGAVAALVVVAVVVMLFMK